MLTKFCCPICKNEQNVKNNIVSQHYNNILECAGSNQSIEYINQFMLDIEKVNSFLASQLNKVETIKI